MNSYQQIFFLKSKQILQLANQVESVGTLLLTSRRPMMLQDNAQIKL